MSTFSFLQDSQTVEFDCDTFIDKNEDEDKDEDEDDIEDEEGEQEVLYEVDDQVQDYRPAAYRFTKYSGPSTAATPVNVPADSHSHASEDTAPLTAFSTSALLPPARTVASSSSQPHASDHQVIQPHRTASHTPINRTATDSTDPRSPTLRRTNIAALSSPVRPQRHRDALEMLGRSGNGGDHYGDYDFEDFEDTGYSQRNPFEVTNNPHQTAQDWTIQG